jgi:beta-galactosidase
LPETAVAFVHDYDVHFAYEAAGLHKFIHYETNFLALHRAFYRRNVRVAVVPPTADLTPYRLVVLPSLMIVHPTLAENLKKFVAAGGVVLAQGQLGLRDANNNYLPDRAPDRLHDLFGVWLHGGMYLESSVAVDESWGFRRPFQTRLTGQLGRATAAGWLGDLEARDCRVLAKVAEDNYQGQPAIVEKPTGQGLAIYSAVAKLDERAWQKLADYGLKRAGLPALRGVPEHVEVIRRGARTFVINHLAKPVRVKLPGQTLSLPAFGVADW